jgi:hypothetical protein
MREATTNSCVDARGDGPMLVSATLLVIPH